MPVQPDWAEPVIAESGDSTKDTVGAQLHRYAGKKDESVHRHACTYRNAQICTGTESRGSNLVSVSFQGECVCVGRCSGACKSRVMMEVCLWKGQSFKTSDRQDRRTPASFSNWSVSSIKFKNIFYYIFKFFLTPHIPLVSIFVCNSFVRMLWSFFCHFTAICVLTFALFLMCLSY